MESFISSSVIALVFGLSYYALERYKRRREYRRMVRERFKK